MLTKVLYTASATSTGGRNGHSKTADGALDLTLAKPTEMGGTGEGVNPEQLFAAGYSACFLGALQFYAGQKNVAVPDDATVTVSAGIGPREDEKGFGLDVKIQVSLPGIDEATAKDLIAGAHVVCPYSHATSGTLSITPELV